MARTRASHQAAIRGRLVPEPGDRTLDPRQPFVKQRKTKPNRCRSGGYRGAHGAVAFLGEGPIKGCTQVTELASISMKPVRCRALVEFRLGPVEDDPYMFGVTAALRIGLAAFLQLALPIHPGGVEQVIAERLLLEFCDHQRLVEKTCQAVVSLAEAD
jgi:hypothetical protein